MVQVIWLTLSLRIVLIVCAALVLLFIIRRIKKSKIDVMDSIFWLFFSLSFVVLALFPQVASFFAGLLGIQASANYVIVYVIAVLVIRDFSNTTKIAMLRKKIEGLIQEVALRG